MHELEQLEWSSVKESPAPDEIEALQSQLAVELPQAYIECVKNYHAAHPSPDEFDAEGFGTSCIHHFYPVNEEFPKSSSVMRKLRFLSERLPESTIPFARTPGGDQICFDYRVGATPRIILCDHELDDENGKMVAHLVADTFEDFIKKLA